MKTFNLETEHVLLNCIINLSFMAIAWKYSLSRAYIHIYMLHIVIYVVPHVEISIMHFLCQFNQSKTACVRVCMCECVCVCVCECVCVCVGVCSHNKNGTHTFLSL